MAKTISDIYTYICYGDYIFYDSGISDTWTSGSNIWQVGEANVWAS